jgi:hypothetical protein
MIPVLLDSVQYFFISHTIGPTDLHRPSPAPPFKIASSSNKIKKVLNTYKNPDNVFLTKRPSPFIFLEKQV